MAKGDVLACFLSALRVHEIKGDEIITRERGRSADNIKDGGVLVQEHFELNSWFSEFQLLN